MSPAMATALPDQHPSRHRSVKWPVAASSNRTIDQPAASPGRPTLLQASKGASAESGTSADQASALCVAPYCALINVLPCCHFLLCIVSCVQSMCGDPSKNAAQTSYGLACGIWLDVELKVCSARARHSVVAYAACCVLPDNCLTMHQAKRRMASKLFCQLLCNSTLEKSAACKSESRPYRCTHTYKL